MADNPSREDPVLVRPYVKAAADRAPDEEPATWPEEATRPTNEDTPTIEQPVVEDAKAEPPRRPRRSRTGIIAGAAVLALAVAGYLIFAPATDQRIPLPDTALPTMPGQAPIVPAKRASAAPSVTPSTSATTTPSPSADPSTSVQPLIPASDPPPPPSSQAPADPTLTPPANDRTGSVTAASGRCLMLGGLLGTSGSPVQVSGCASVPYQSFTLAADGTLRVNGRCAQAGGDGTVRVTGCDDAPQWRAGDGGTLRTANGCLTDPGRSGATTTVSECSGASTQSWTLP